MCVDNRKKKIVRKKKKQCCCCYWCYILQRCPHKHMHTDYVVLTPTSHNLA